MAYAGADTLLNTDEFSTILNDRTFNWKMRATVDYSPVNGDADGIPKKMYDGLLPPEEKPKKQTEDEGEPITEGDFFGTSSKFIQLKEKKGDEGP